MTPEQAKAELAKRELARRELARRNQENPETQEPSKNVSGSPLTAPSPMLAGLPEHIRMPLETVFRREEGLPAIGQAVGGLYGDRAGMRGAGLGGSLGGQVVGEAGRQAVNVIKGEEQGFDLKKLGVDAAVTAAVEGATRGVGNRLFRRQLTNRNLGDLSKKLSGMKEALSKNPNAAIDSIEIYMPLKESVEGVAVPHGPQSGVINKWLKFMENNPKLTAKNLIELESDLGEVAKFGEMEKGAFIAPSGVKKPSLNTIAKTSRKQVSGIVDDLAEKSGQKGFGPTSKKISKIMRDPSSYDVTKTSGGGEIQRVGAALGIGGATQNPLIGILSYLGMRAAQNPTVRNKAFKVVESGTGKAVGATVKPSLSEMFRRSTRGSK